MPVQTRYRYLAIVRGCVCLLTIAALSGCTWLAGGNTEPAVPAEGQPIPATVTTVLPEGSTLTAYTAAGKIQIEAGPDSLRIFNWDDARRGVATLARTKPFPSASSLGLYFDGKPPIWAPYDGIDKVHYEETTRNFETPIDLKIWTQIRRLYFSYNNNGLAVGWKRKGDTLHVEVWQFYINGEKPEQLPEANDQLIVLQTKS